MQFYNFNFQCVGGERERPDSTFLGVGSLCVCGSISCLCRLRLADCPVSASCLIFHFAMSVENTDTYHYLQGWGWAYQLTEQTLLPSWLISTCVCVSHAGLQLSMYPAWPQNHVLSQPPKCWDYLLLLITPGKPGLVCLFRFLCASVLSVCMYAHHMRTWCLGRSEEGVGSLGTTIGWC